MRREDRERQQRENAVGRSSEGEQSHPRLPPDNEREKVKGGPTSGSRTTPSSEQPRGRMPLPD